MTHQQIQTIKSQILETTEGQEQAFPCVVPMDSFLLQGMSLRDWFAGMAMMGICSNPDESAPTWTSSRHDVIAKSAYSWADVMMEFRKSK